MTHQNALSAIRARSMVGSPAIDNASIALVPFAKRVQALPGQTSATKFTGVNNVDPSKGIIRLVGMKSALWRN
jgi:hypothetical protein